MSEPFDAVVRRLVDEAAIRTVLARYARAVDRLDWDLLRTCYHSDAHEDRGRYVGPVDGFFAWIRGVLEGLEGAWHLIGTPLIELEGDVASVESYCLAVQRAGEEDRLIPCRYCDRFERRDGEWRIARRVAVYESAWTRPASDAPPLGATSRRDRDDPAYGCR